MHATMGQDKLDQEGPVSVGPTSRNTYKPGRLVAVYTPNGAAAGKRGCASGRWCIFMDYNLPNDQTRLYLVILSKIRYIPQSVSSDVLRNSIPA